MKEEPGSAGSEPPPADVDSTAGEASESGGEDPAVLRLDGVEKTYKQGKVEVEALRGVTLTIRPNRFVSILGPSGSGKSTLLNLLGALDSPTAGRILFEGRDVAGLSERERTRFRARSIGFIFQFFNLLPGLTCSQNVALAGAIGGMGPRASRRKAKSLLEDVGLADKVATSARELSGGQMQRVAIARALVNEPRLVLADEPTGNLDHRNAEEIMKVLRDRARDGRTVILVTHNDDLAERYSDEVVTLMDGRVETTHFPERGVA